MMLDCDIPAFFDDLGVRPQHEDWTEERIDTPHGPVICLAATGRHCDTSTALEILHQEIGLDLSTIDPGNNLALDCPVFGYFAETLSPVPYDPDYVPPRYAAMEANFMPPFEEPQSGEDAFNPPPLIDPLRWGDEEPPARRWIVDGWIPWRHVTGLYGPPGNGKSLLAQMLLTACALGQPWLGMQTARVKVFGLFCEDEHDELWRRQHAINRHFACSSADLEGMLLTSLHGLPSMLMDFQDDGLAGTKLYDWLLGQVKEFGAQLIVVDTAAATFGGDENSRAQVTRYLNEILARIAHEIDGAVVLCAHPSKSSDYSGSTAWDASFRSRLNLTRYEDDDEAPAEELTRLRILEKQKANYAGIGDKLILEWYDGYFRVQGADSGTVARIERNVRERQADEAFLAALDALTEQQRNVSHSPQAKNYAPRVMRSHQATNGFTKTDLAGAMDRLLNSGAIKANMPVGKHHNRTRSLGLARVPQDCTEVHNG